uniref:Transposase n=1 Tax=Candidatus Methanosuratincola petrocarbonis (ex Vanwonterghem et al. 2016) TaxID=1867261 RepID=A0A7J3V0G7_9CREN
MLKTYSLKHDKREEVEGLLRAYNEILNAIIEDIWSNIRWKQVKIQGKNQFKLLPIYRKDNQFKKCLRDKNLKGWIYAAHWVDSALKTAFSIMDSWKKNYVKGDRKRVCPKARRLFIRVKQTLCKLEGDNLRVTTAPKSFVYFDLSKRYFKIPREISSSGIGEPIITLNRIYLPIHAPDKRPEPAIGKIAWDSNMLSLDGYSPKIGWVKIDTKALATVHISSFEKRRSVQREAKSKKAKRVLNKYSRREMNKARKHQLEIARVINSLAEVNGFERLRKERMYRRSRVWNRRVMRTDWRAIMRRVDGSTELPPQHTSKGCSRCGCINRDLNGCMFRCGSCGLTIDRQLNAAINLYLRMEGVPHQMKWWDKHILPSLVGGYFLTGAELKAPYELVRGLYEAVKPKLLYAYDRHADAYLPVPT